MEKRCFGLNFSVKPDEEGEGEVSFFPTVSINHIEVSINLFDTWTLLQELANELV